MSKTSSFGTPWREGHDSSPFYRRNLYANDAASPATPTENAGASAAVPIEGWADRVYRGSARITQSLH